MYYTLDGIYFLRFRLNNYIRKIYLVMRNLQVILVCVMSGVFITNIFSQDTIDSLYKISQQQFSSGNYADALNSNFKALKIIEEGKDCNLLAYGNIKVGKMYYFLHDKQLALHYFFKSSRMADSCNIDSLKHLSLYNIGVIYTEKGKNDSALFFLNRAKNILEKDTADYNNLAKVNAVLADLHLLHTHNLELALKYIKDAEKYAEKSGSKDWMPFIQIKYSIYYRLIKNYPMAIKHAQIALELYEKNGAVEDKMYALYVLAGSFALSGDSKSYGLFQKLFALKDSVFKIETAKKIADYRTLYETEKKEKENILLNEKNKVNQLQIDSKNKTIIGLLICLLLFIIIVFWRISVINLKKKERLLEAQQKLQIERERISRDLHDNVGGQLSYVLFSLEANEETTAEKRKEKSTDLASSIRSITRNLRETIWALNQEKLSLKNLSDKLKIYTRNIFTYTNTQIRFKETIENDSELNPAFALSLFRICQEAVNNAFKHANATELVISIERKEKITIIISDNGIGFDRNNVNEVEHYGLANLLTRSKEINATINMESAVNNGCKVTLVV